MSSLLRFQLISFVYLAVSILSAANTLAEAAPTRPNILILLADNWAYPHASALGDPVVHTPTFDALANEGMLFRNAFCQVPSCSSSRAVLLTGKVSHQLRDAGNLWGHFPKEFETFPLSLAEAGYKVGYTIKGWGPGRYLGERHSRGNPNPAGFKSESFEAFLESIDDSPFCFWFGSHDPHRPWTPDSENLKGLDHSQIAVPGYLPDHEVVRKEMLDYYAEIQRFDMECGMILQLLEGEGKLENTIVIMLGDNGWQMPRGLANVYDAGTHVPLVMQWPGFINGGVTVDTFVSFEDFAPTLFDLLGIRPDWSMTGKSFKNVLTGKTLNHRSEVFLERERHANVRTGNRSYPCRAIRTNDFLWIWNLSPELSPAGDAETYWAVGPFGDIDNSETKSLLLGADDASGLARFRNLAIGMRPEFELYDLKADPWQVNNVSGSRDYRRIERGLRTQVLRWMKATDDPRFAQPKTNVFDQYEYFGSRARIPEK